MPTADNLFDFFNLFSPTLVNAGDLTALTNSVMNGWRASTNARWAVYFLIRLLDPLI